ncbi:MAG: hypothetical protein WC824_08155 [Bacteroidota bacterium]|jgi:transcription antitermination factor NusG
MADSRDAITWIVLELSPQGEIRLEDGTLEECIRSDLGVDDNHPVFIPATTYVKGNKTITLRLMEGYVFVASGLLETTYFALEQRPYIAQVMSSRPGPYKLRVISTVPDRKILELKKQLRDMKASSVSMYDRVSIHDGTYKSLEGVVLGISGENAFIRINLRSMEVIATIPLLLMETIGSEKSDSLT